MCNTCFPEQGSGLWTWSLDPSFNHYQRGSESKIKLDQDLFLFLFQIPGTGFWPFRMYTFHLAFCGQSLMCNCGKLVFLYEHQGNHTKWPQSLTWVTWFVPSGMMDLYRSNGGFPMYSIPSSIKPIRSMTHAHALLWPTLLFPWHIVETGSCNWSTLILCRSASNGVWPHYNAFISL